MHLCLSLREKNGELVLPIHYNRLIQGAIYNNISTELAAFLHDRGYVYNGRSFKLFSFSRILGNYKLDRVNKQISFSGDVKLYISSPVQEFCTSLMGCLLGEGIHLGGTSVEVVGIKAEKPVVSGEVIEVELLSPVVIYSTFLKPEGGKYTCYFHPGEKEFVHLLETNLRKKYRAFYGTELPEGDFGVETLNRPCLNITMYKHTVIKGYSCRIKLGGPPELLQVAVDAGLGGKNSQGFGYIRLCGNGSGERRGQS